MKQENIKKLQEDLDSLIDKHSLFIKNNEFGQALNVMKNIDMITDQLKNLDYETKVSKYSIMGEDCKDQQLISIWQQNGFGDIKDINTYVIKEKYNKNFGESIDNITNHWGEMPKEMQDTIAEFIGGERNKQIVNTVIDDLNK